MSMQQDIRWEQRLTNYNKALAKLNQAVQRAFLEFQRIMEAKRSNG